MVNVCVGVQPAMGAYKCFDAYSLSGLPLYKCNDSAGSTLQYILMKVLAYVLFSPFAIHGGMCTNMAWTHIYIGNVSLVCSG